MFSWVTTDDEQHPAWSSFCATYNHTWWTCSEARRAWVVYREGWNARDRAPHSTECRPGIEDVD